MHKKTVLMTRLFCKFYERVTILKVFDLRFPALNIFVLIIIVMAPFYTHVINRIMFA